MTNTRRSFATFQDRGEDKVVFQVFSWNGAPDEEWVGPIAMKITTAEVDRMGVSGDYRSNRGNLFCRKESGPRKGFE